MLELVQVPPSLLLRRLEPVRLRILEKLGPVPASMAATR
jgi:hypothetical protein